MRSSAGSFLLGAVLGAAIALAVGLVVFGWGNARSPLEAVELAAPAAGGARPASAQASTPMASPAEVARTPGAAVAATTRVEMEVDPTRLRSLIDAAGEAAPDLASGSGSLWGRVRDADGKGLGGVVLRAQGRSSWTRAESPTQVGQAPPPLDDLDQLVRTTVERYQQSRAQLYETNTDATGAYRFDGLPDGSWQVQAFKRDWVVTPSAGRMREVPTGSELDFTAAPVVAVPVAVLRPGGAPADSAVIRCEASGERARDYTWSAADPILRLTPGRYELTALDGAVEGARGAEYDLKSPPQAVELVGGSAPEALRFQLEGRVGIRGRLRLPSDGVTGANPRVHLLHLGRDAEPDLVALAESDRDAWLSGGNEYAFLDLADGRYMVGASRTLGGEICVHAVVEVAGTITRCDLELPPVDLTRVLTATVTGSDGRTLDGVRFSLRHESDGGSRSGGVQELRLADGRYLIPLRQEAQEAYFGTPGAQDRFTLEASHRDHGKKSVELLPGQTEVAVSFRQPARLEVTVAGYAGSTVEGRLMLSLERAGTGNPWEGFGWERLPPDGVQAFEAVEPGSYRVRMTLTERAGSRLSFGNQGTLLLQPVELVAGPNALDLAVPLLYELVVSHPEAEAGTRLQLSSSDDPFGGRSAQTDEQGRAVFEDVPAGHYSLGCWSPYGQMEIDVPCGVVTFEAQVMDALRVSITEADGALASAGLRDGDLVVAVNGEELTSQQDFFLLYRKTRDFTLSVLRGRERVDLAIEQIDWMDPMKLGGSLTPASR